MHGSIAVALALMVFATGSSAAGDWPQFLGPTRNGVYGGSEVAGSWPAGGPTVTWQKPAGHGFSGPAVAGHKLILFSRRADAETVECLDAATGGPVWSFAYPTDYRDDFGFDDGPRATPAIADARVYTFGAEGNLHCLDLATGKKLWNVDTKSEFHTANGFFGMACSPLVEGSAVLLNVGGKGGAGLVAFDKATGRVLWKATDDEAGYSSPVAATLGDKRSALFLTRAGFVAVDPSSGAVRFQHPWRSRSATSVNAATPLVVGDSVFLSACYGTGAILLRVGERGLDKVWSGDDLLSNHYATSVEHKGFLYGIHGRTDPGYRPTPRLRCLELKTGTVRWETETIGAASVTLAGDRLILLTEKGELVNAAASPEGFQPAGRASILSSEVRAFPAIADGLLYARSKDQLICVDLRARR